MNGPTITSNQFNRYRFLYYPLFFFRALIATLFFITPSYGEGTFSDRVEQAKNMYYSGNLEMALSEFRELREHGGAETLYYLALIYQHEGDNRDLAQAFSLLLEASSENYAPAVRELGRAYEQGKGVTADLLKAIDFYRKADALEKVTQTSIQFYTQKNGHLVGQDIQQQIRQLEAAAATGDLDAPYQLAKLYDEGSLVIKNPPKALHWYRKAAESGHKYSRLILGYLICRGIGTPKNTVIANHWLDLSGRHAECIN